MTAPADAITSVRDRLANAPRGANLMVGFAVLIAVDLVIVLALLTATAPHAIPIALPIVIAAPLAAFFVINLILWRPIARRFPAQPQKPDAVVKLCQSFALSTLRRMNNCVHIAADDAHLHLIPFAPLRWTGASVISIPWSAMRLRSGKTRMGLLTADVGRLRMTGPEWCMRLAPAPHDPSSKTTTQSTAEQPLHS